MQEHFGFVEDERWNRQGGCRGESYSSQCGMRQGSWQGLWQKGCREMIVVDGVGVAGGKRIGKWKRCD